MSGIDPRHADNPEAVAVSALAVNVAFDRPTGNGVGWDACAIAIKAGEVRYCTTGGLGFGWRVDATDFQEYREDAALAGEAQNTWWFFLRHPAGENIPEESSLRRAASAAGWLED